MSDDEMTGQPPLEATAEAVTAPETAAEPEAEDPNEVFLRTFNAIGNSRQVERPGSPAGEPAATAAVPAATAAVPAPTAAVPAPTAEIPAAIAAAPAAALSTESPTAAATTTAPAAPPAPTWQPFFMATSAATDAATAEPATAPPAPTWQPFFMAPAATATAAAVTATAATTAPGTPALSIVPAPGDAAAAATSTGRLGRAGTKARPLAVTMATLALFTAGVAGGVALAYARSAPSSVPSTSSLTGDSPTSVQEVEAALRSNDADRIRVSIDPEPFSLLEGALAAGSISHVTDVQELGTIVDGNRSATALIIRGVDLEGTPLVVPLNVHTTDGIIETFR